jgi:ribosomal protein S18 acetylase RimI-like enzyme
MQHTTLATLTTEQLADAFNVVYTDYVMPAHFTLEGIAAHVTDNDIALAQSPLWLDDAGNVIGLSALGVRGERGWIGGFGVAATYRGQGLSHSLMTAALDMARDAGPRHVQLEVLTPNTKAIRTYERAGFTITRETVVWEKPSSKAQQTNEGQDAGTVREAPVADTIALLDALHPIPPTWQRESASLAHMAHITSYATTTGGAAVAMPTTGTRLRIGDIAGNSTDDLIALIGFLEARFAANALFLVNEPADSPLRPILSERKWKEVIRQYEMVMRIG